MTAVYVVLVFALLAALEGLQRRWLREHRGGGPSEGSDRCAGEKAP